SKGDMTRLKEYVRSTHDDPLPVGLFIPFADAFKAVKEFMETEGQLPKSIDWVRDEDLPPDIFPDP
ncbi:MAG: Imm1 family immunity protein, partial [Hyphomicrobiaceae bacterium]